MALNILKDKEIKEAKAKEKLYFFNDGGGLRLAVNLMEQNFGNSDLL